MTTDGVSAELEVVCKRALDDLAKLHEPTGAMSCLANVQYYTDEFNRLVGSLRKSYPDSFGDIYPLESFHSAQARSVKGLLDEASEKLLLIEKMNELVMTMEKVRVRLAGMQSSDLPQVGALQRLHPEIAKVSARLFRDEHYSEAILEAFKAVNSYVKQKSRLALDGQHLMEQAFKEDDPVVRLNKGSTQSDKDEQKGFKFLYMGAMTGIRNPKAHELVTLSDPDRALEYLALASLLMRRAEESTVARKRQRKKPIQQTRPY